MKLYLCLVIALINFNINGCTGIRLKTLSNSIIYARTLEFGHNLNSDFIFIPRNLEFTGVTPCKSRMGLNWKSKYSAIGANAEKLNLLIDGVNEKGLAGGLFYFPGYAEYQAVQSEDLEKTIAPWQLMTWILTNFCNVNEVKAALPNIKVGNVTFDKWNLIPPVHAIVHDTNGACLVIEYVKGKLRILDNPIGVFTNSPDFEWHITNLRNYVNLTILNVPKVSIAGIKLNAFGQGSGMLGLPGDFTPPSRFVRAVAFSQAAITSKTEEETVKEAFHILNLFDIPQGSIRETKDQKKDLEITQWTSAADTKNLKYYMHSYKSRQIRMLDLKKLINNKEVITIPMEIEERIVDVTPIQKQIKI